jgi:hypothetical protein
LAVLLDRCVDNTIQTLGLPVSIYAMRCRFCYTDV